MNLSLEEYLEIVHPVIDWFEIVIYVSAAVSFAFCALLSYIVYRYTPDTMHSRKVCLLNLLAGCLVLTLFYALSGPMPLLPFRIVIFSGPLKSFGSTTAAILYVLWFADMTFVSNGCLIASLSHYLDLTTGLSSQNCIFRYLRSISLQKRMIIFNYYHLQHSVTSIVTMSLIYIDFDFTPQNNSIEDMLQDEHAMILLQNRPYTGLLVTLSFVGWLFSYASGVVYLNYSISRQMKGLRKTISSKTFSLLSSMSGIFFSLVIAPIVFFFLPHLIFNVCNFQWPGMVSTPKWLIFFTLAIAGLYGAFPFSIYLFLLVGFKQYRNALFHLLTFHQFDKKSTPTNSRFS